MPEPKPIRSYFWKSSGLICRSDFTSAFKVPAITPAIFAVLLFWAEKRMINIRESPLYLPEAGSVIVAVAFVTASTPFFPDGNTAHDDTKKKSIVKGSLL
jgi:hypothetical protein